MSILVRPGTCITCGHWQPDCLYQICKRCRRAFGQKKRIQEKHGRKAAEAWEAARLKKIAAAIPSAPDNPLDRLPGRWSKSA